jgi:molecular chaperone GrpE
MTKKKVIDFEELANQLAQELAEANDALLRERADAANVRRRADEDRIKLSSFYKSNVVKELLPVIDNFERALKAIPADLVDHDYVKGIQSIVKQFEQTLEKMGVSRIKTIGEKFNPHIHEAVTMEEGEGTEEIVSEELQAGYIVGDEVIRHAMVRVRPQ